MPPKKDVDELLNIRVKQLNLDSIPPNIKNMWTETQGGCKIVVIGKPGTGKTTLIESLLYHKKHIFPCGMVFNGTEDANSFYSRIFPEAFIYSKLDEERFRDFKKRQILARKYIKNPWAFLIVDDCTDDPKIFRKPFMQDIFKNGRQWKMNLIMSLQYCMDLLPVIRNSIDMTFILRETQLSNRKKLWENYAGCVPDFETFCTVMDSVTGDRTALVVDNMIDTGSWQDRIFWYKADQSKIKPFKIGSTDYWDFNLQRYNTESVSVI